MNRRHMTGDHHGQTAGRTTLLARAMDEILGTHRSRTPGTASMAHTASVRLPWLTMQPFGLPVVPEVYTMVASVSAVTARRRRST
jgi:hypothetical protein